jgi:hypothetical protein
MQIIQGKTKEKGLDFLGFLWPNPAFSMGYGESKQKNLFPLSCLARTLSRLGARERSSVWE